MDMIKSAILSDLFFNQDHGDCVIQEKGQFKGYDWEKLKQKADEFAENINILNEANIITGNEVLQDFQDRL